MKVITIEETAFQKMENMFSDACSLVKQLAAENRRLKNKKLLSSHEVAEITGYHEKTIRSKKEEIGFFTTGKGGCRCVDRKELYKT